MDTVKGFKGTLEVLIDFGLQNLRNHIFFLNKKWVNPGLFLFLFNKNFYRKIVYFSGIRTQIVGVEGKHADHLNYITYTVPIDESFQYNKIVCSVTKLGDF